MASFDFGIIRDALDVITSIILPIAGGVVTYTQVREARIEKRTRNFRMANEVTPEDRGAYAEHSLDLYREYYADTFPNRETLMKSNTTLNGFYYFGGLSSKRFCQAITAECDGTFTCWEGANYNLHTHDYFKTFDFFGVGKPSRIAFNDRDVREDDKALAPSDNLYNVSAPWFKNLDKEWIDKFVEVYKKVAENYKDLLEGDDDKIQGGRWHGAENAENQQKKK